jgi:hypothetical protein
MLGGRWRRHAQRHGRTAAHLAAPGLCIDKATRNALHGSGSGPSAAATSPQHGAWLDGLASGLGRAGASLPPPSAN